ncbi:ArgS-related anticodon-binding protein NrtL [Streptomyces sp. NPDC005813]|uniref:ArgS-related anticodon-binding protein NrtL n=1 Tax=Streptomyces sp. NPDC005813 TaxID=3155592 RepID=UPI0033C5CD53
MTPVELSRTVLCAVRRAVDSGELNVAVPARVVVTVPGPGGCGDYATNVALQLARPAGRPARQVAEILRPHIGGAAGVAGVEITGPGFLNISLGREASTALVADVLARGAGYGHGDALAGQVVELRVPYDTRAEVVADALVRIVATQGGRAEVRHVESGNPRSVLAPEHRGVRVAGPQNAHPEPRDPEPRHPEVRHPEPRHPEPRHPEVRHAEAGHPEPRHPEVRHAEAGHPEARHQEPRHPEPVNLRPVPAPEDPAPLGADAARWALLHPAPHDRPRISADHLVQRESNPLFRVRYAHARTRALLRNAAALGYTGAPGDVRDLDRAGDLLGALAEYPHALRVAAADRTPDRLARHLVVIADALLAVQHTVLPLGDEKPMAAHRARLALADAAGTVLAGGLSLLGISAPDHL